MHFYVDESGHTGPNLFDPQQPMLYYGVLSSKLNVDVLAVDRVRRMRVKLGVERLHASELGTERLSIVVDDLLHISNACQLRFDLYRIAKPDHAIISFFDQVFDQGLNPALTWTSYWTPLRYMLLLKVASLFTDDLAERAWAARLELDDEKSNGILLSVCADLRDRVGRLPDARSRELITDALTWASNNPDAIHYNAKTKRDALSVMPNMIGFQSVMLGIANRLSVAQRKASRIIVDRQSQFNKAQKTLADFYASAKGIQFASGPGMPEVSFAGIPTTPIEFSSSFDSTGLELVDLYLWTFKRGMERKEITPELHRLIEPQFQRGRTDEISLGALANRWSNWFNALPTPTPEQEAKAREIMAIDEGRRRTAIGK